MYDCLVCGVVVRLLQRIGWTLDFGNSKIWPAHYEIGVIKQSYLFRMCKLWFLLNCNHAHSSLHFVEDIQARYIRYSLDVALDTSYPLHQLQK